MFYLFLVKRCVYLCIPLTANEKGHWGVTVMPPDETKRCEMVMTKARKGKLGRIN